MRTKDIYYVSLLIAIVVVACISLLFFTLNKIDTLQTEVTTLQHQVSNMSTQTQGGQHYTPGDITHSGGY
jgi:cell division protein FtsL